MSKILLLVYFLSISSMYCCKAFNLWSMSSKLWELFSFKLLFVFNRGDLEIIFSSLNEFSLVWSPKLLSHEWYGWVNLLCEYIPADLLFSTDEFLSEKYFSDFLFFFRTLSDKLFKNFDDTSLSLSLKIINIFWHFTTIYLIFL